MILRTHVPRVSIAQIRASFPPRVFAQLREVRLDRDGQAVMVGIEQMPDAGVFGGVKRWLICPACGRRTMVLGYHETWGCRRCLGWREPP
jgi:hypothetical protein